jgi:hypothetical protein
MQTWLDWYVAWSVEREMDGGNSLPPEIRKNLEGKSYLEWCRALMTRDIHMVYAADPGWLRLETDDDWRKDLDFHFLVALGAFISSDWRDKGDVVAIKPSADLVAALSKAKPPSGQDALVHEALKETPWYIDLPDGAISIGHHQVRALLTNFSHEMLLVHAVLTSKGSNKATGHLYFTFEDEKDNVLGRLPEGVDPNLVQQEIRSLLSLLILYRGCATQAERGTVPHKAPSDMVGRRAAQNRKKFSMFRVETLSPPPDRFGRVASAEDRNGWKLGWRSEVAGHFKMQPYGPQRALRKLIFVESYKRGPEDAPHKHTLERPDLPVN